MVDNTKDINDVFDTILLAEERLTQEGHADGFSDGKKSLEEQRNGFLRGVDIAGEYASEIGTYWGFATVWLGYLQMTKSSNSKKVKILSEMKDSISEFIACDPEDPDIHQIIANIRAKHKQARSLLNLTSRHGTTANKDEMSF